MTAKPQVVYKLRHKKSGKFLGKSFHSKKPWAFVKTGGRIFNHPRYIASMFRLKEITEAMLIRWGLGTYADYEVVPFVLVEQAGSTSLGDALDSYIQLD